MKKLVLLGGVFFFLLAGCGSSYLANSTNVSKQKRSYDKILVVSKTKDKTARINFENQVVNDLAANGITAQTSIEVIRSESFSKEVTEEQIASLRERLLSEGFDGVIITNLINAEEYTDVTPGTMGTGYYPVRYGRFGRYYNAYPMTYWEPDRVETGVEYTLESCLYDISVDQKDNLQWVGRFKVKNPSDLMDAIEKYSNELTTALLESNISQ